MKFTRNVNGRLLRCGYTTGSCAAAAAKAAGIMLLKGNLIDNVSITTPKGIDLTLDLLDISLSEDYASCAVRKDSGDDPDVTDGILLYARVEKRSAGIIIEGGKGVGRITKPGLDQPVGAAAINSIPREMITNQLIEIAEHHGYTGGFSVIISVPAGEKLARRTFNPKMGIADGISILGTTGIVEPMSHQAITDTIRLELKQLRQTGTRNVLFTPGNYGERFTRTMLKLSMNNHVTCSNFIGDALDSAAELGFQRILLIGHIGKLVKLGINITNTHSSFGDGRIETLLSCALKAGASLSLLKKMANTVTADGALILIEEAGLLKKTMLELGNRIDTCLKQRVPENVTIGYICFTNTPPLSGILVKSANANELMDIWRIIT